jgi:hypothetical protein
VHAQERHWAAAERAIGLPLRAQSATPTSSAGEAAAAVAAVAEPTTFGDLLQRDITPAVIDAVAAAVAEAEAEAKLSHTLDRCVLPLLLLLSLLLLLLPPTLLPLLLYCYCCYRVCRRARFDSVQHAKCCNALLVLDNCTACSQCVQHYSISTAAKVYYIFLRVRMNYVSTLTCALHYCAESKLLGYRRSSL